MTDILEERNGPAWYRVEFQFNGAYMRIDFFGTYNEVDNAAEEFAKRIGGAYMHQEFIGRYEHG